MSNKEYQILVSRQTWEETAVPYFDSLKANPNNAGLYFRKRLLSSSSSALTCLAASTDNSNIVHNDDDDDNNNYYYTMLYELLNTKQPQIFAESAIVGGDSGNHDWNMIELAILGDISMALPVTIYDNGRHRPKPEDVHPKPFQGYLLYVPGALLNNEKGQIPCDVPQVTKWDTESESYVLDPTKYSALYERRLLPALLYANTICQEQNKHAFVTVPGLGCGMFAGKYRHDGLTNYLNATLQTMLQRHHSKLSHIRAVYYDPYNEGSNERKTIGHITYMVRPLLKGGTPQLCHPEVYEGYRDDFSDCMLFSFVAWDHVSWPGNDYWIGSRATDDGVKAAATDTMRVMTGGYEGQYDSANSRLEYVPPKPFHTWNEVVLQNNLKIELQPNQNFHIL